MSGPAICVIFALGLAAAAGCGDDGPVATDAGAVDAGADSALGTPVTPPRQPAPPRLGPCSAGWAAVPVDGLPEGTCEPWPAGHPACSDGTHRFPGDSACAPLGSPCPAGDFASDAPSEAIFVLAGAAAGGDGSRALPFARIADALAGAASGDVVALSKGTFDETVRLPAGVTLRGACTAGTRIAPTTFAPEDFAVLFAGGPDAAAQDLTVSAALTGIRADGAGRLALRDVRIASAQLFGLVANAGGVIDGEGVVIEDVIPGGFEESGIAIIANEAGIVRLQRAAILRATTAAIMTGETGSRVELTDALIRDTRPTVSGTLGHAVAVHNAASVVMTRTVIESHTTGAIFAGRRSSVELDGCLVRGVRAAPGTDSGIAVTAESGASVIVRRTSIADADLLGISAVGFDTSVSATDVIITQPVDVGTRPTTPAGGAAVFYAAQMSLERVAVVDAMTTALGALGADAVLVVRDVTVLRTRPHPVAQGGHGLSCDEASRCEVDRFACDQATEGALLLLGDGTVLVGSDLSLRRTRSSPLSGILGRGLTVQTGASADITRALVEDNREAGVVAFGAGTRLGLADIVVSGTEPRECASTTCVGQGAGTAVASVDGAAVDMRAFLVTRSAMAGLQLARGGGLIARDGEVSFNAVGVNIQDAGFDLADVTDNVLFRGNGVNLDYAELPVPDPG